MNGSIYSTDAVLTGKIKLGTSSKIVFSAGSQDDYAIDNNEGEGYMDINVPIVVTGTGPADPTIANLAGLTGMKLYTFVGTGSQVHECWGQIHINHDYKPNTPIYLHAHVLTDATTLTGNYKIFFDYTVAKSGEVFTPIRTVSVVDNFTATLQHRISEISSPILANELEIDSVIMIRMYRNPADPSDSFAGDLHLIYIDAHVQVSKFSSKYRNKNTTGSFYQ